MFKIIIKMVVFLGLSVGLYAESGLTQSHLLSVSPSASETGVSPDTSVEVKFDLPIKEKSVKKHTIVLKQNHKKIKGVTTLVGNDTLHFTPNEILEEGDYTVKVKKVKLQKENNDTQHKPKTEFEKFIYWLCSLFYDNPADCTLCKKICANSNNNIIKTQKIQYDFTVDDSPKIINILLSEIASIELNEGNETTLSVTVNYDDNTTQDITNEVEWVIEDSSIVSVANGRVKALKEGMTTVQAKYEGKTSESLNMIVYKEINGYRLPPEPDPSVNNATLLGVDSNANGVRDDVERWIYITYKDKHPVHIDIAMQAGRGYRQVLETPERAQEITQSVDSVIDCESYYMVYAKYFNQPILIKERIDDKIARKYFNTEERNKVHEQYDTLLSGGVYSTPEIDENLTLYCDFDTIQYKE